MVLPVIPIAIGMGVSALWGVYKGGKAVKDNSEAKDINASAQEIINSANKSLEASREICEQALEELGQKKYDALTKNIHSFINVFGRIKNVELSQDQSLEELKIAEFSNEVLEELKKEISFFTSSSLGALGGSAAGAMAAFGAYSGTMAFAAAGTGTAISTLSGAAATNATLAWLGGGTIASGGFGMAGGAMMLNVITIAPALAIAGWYMGNQAAKQLNDAKSNKELALKYEEDSRTTVTFTDGIAEIAVNSIEVLSLLRKASRRSTKALENITLEKGFDYQQYEQSDKEVVLRSLKLVQLLKAVIDTPILNEKGELLGDASSNINNIKKVALSM